MRLTDYDLSGENRISARFLGYLACAEVNRIYLPVSFEMALIGLSRTLVTIRALIAPVLPSSQ